eukprot:CAMPEP_0175063264 /NCGR_PEP_ID=MMETSP0052_2-20121109/14652_1 /TAXON_ID=51329 ORGANISM="Polytomella parva, Strain SAG 63-3" /NCGR_SAMPLE_ID=MMETSP0052_2 /ASSEMBLY_ACC=CAM_ASM_000194 /LENGTH=488 /DNA_ID=CAMNT_0016329427 /DNA_START=106 /DNA_END=1573 /DNA_ORIENTATION=-
MGKDDGNSIYSALGALGIALAVKNSLNRHKFQHKKISYSVARPALEYSPGAKKVLVTGGCGFLGRHIVSALLQKFGSKINVYVFDACPPPANPDSRVTYIRGDLTSYTHVEMAVTKAAVVIHAGALVHLANVTAEKVGEVIEQGTKNVVEACLEKEVPSIVYTSSAIVNLPNDRVITDPVAESDLVTEETAVGQYAISKLRAEKLVTHVDCHVLHTITLRPGGIYGLGDRFLVDGLIAGQPFVGSGLHQTPMVWVEDAARAHVIATEKLLRFQELKAKALGPILGVRKESTVEAVSTPTAAVATAASTSVSSTPNPLSTEIASAVSASMGMDLLTLEEREEMQRMKVEVFGKSFLITNDSVRDPLVYREFMGGKPIPEPVQLPALNPWSMPYTKSVSLSLMKKLAAVNTTSYTWTGYCPLPIALTPETMRIASMPWPCCSEAARKALGWTSTPWREVAETLVQQKRQEKQPAATATANIEIAEAKKKL